MATTSTDWQIERDIAEAREMTVEEQAQALQTIGRLRDKPITIEVPGNTIGSGIPLLIGTATGEVKNAESKHGEQLRYERFLKRWGLKFKDSVIGTSKAAWQMHTCRLPVFPFEHDNTGRKLVPRVLLDTAIARRVIAWFEELTDLDRWDLCASTRAGRTSERKSRRKSYHGDK